jgi:D-alanine-D-alanine ligase
MQQLLDKLKKHRIGVLAGGCSKEREVSLKSGKAVFDVLLAAGLDVIFVDIKEESESFVEEFDFNVAFIVLHGGFGEDGAIQRILEDKGIPYTGSGPAASHLAFDKILSKNVFIEGGVPVPEWMIAEANDGVSCENVKLPCVIKPGTEGSSIGLSVVSSMNEFSGALKKAGLCGGQIVIEQYIPGRELTVGILDDEPLPVVEIISDDGVFDFKAKYEDDSTGYVVPAKIDTSICREAQRLGEKAHSLLGCRCFSRVDMRLAPSGELFVLEVNTIPGFTERSLLPLAAKSVGVTFENLCLRIMNNAIQ